MNAINLSSLVPLKIAVPLFGYAVPPVAFMVLFVNILLVMTLCRRHMRSPVNSLMVGIATMNTIAITLPVPVSVYFYTSGNVFHYIPFSWCRAYFTTVFVLPLASNMASIWLTAALACVRCLSVWRPLAARALITWYRTNLVAVAIVLISGGVYFPSLFEYTFHPVPLNETSSMREDIAMVGCKVEKSFSHLLNKTFCETHTWAQILLTSLIPWFCILFPDFGLLWRLKKAEVKREKLLLDGEKETFVDNGKDICEKLVSIKQHMKFRQRRRKLTWMIFLNVTLVWLVEIPFAVVFTRILVRNDFDLMSGNIDAVGVIVILMKYITYPMIFIMYCIMSERFRETFKDVVLCRKTATKQLFVAYRSSATQSTDRNSPNGNSTNGRVSRRDRPKNDRRMTR